jgi:HK97 family phage portal protein
MFNWLSTLFGKRQTLQEGAPHVQAVAAHNNLRWPGLTDAATQSRAYTESPWVYLAVNRIAEAGALVPLNVTRIEGDRLVDVVQHPLERLLDSPNPFMSRFELMEQTLGMLELTGNAYWFLAGDSKGTPVQIWPLRPDRVSVVPDQVDYVKGYVYEIDGQRIPMEAVEVIHFKRWHPDNDYYGASALTAARLAVSTDKAMAQWNRNMFGAQYGVPAGMVSVEDGVSDAEFERLKREWRASYGGPQRRTAFLRGKEVKWHDIGLSHTEMDFLKGRQANRDEILNLFGVPVGMVSENATEANAKVAERIFIERTLWPKLVRIAQKISAELLPFWPGQYVANFADIRPTDTRARLAEIRAAYPVLSINEIRERFYHLSPVEWGERPVGNRRPADPVPALLEGSESASASSGESAEPVKAALTELAQWERFTLKRWGRDSRAFEATEIPDDLVFEVSAGLLAAQNPDDARSVFQSAKALLEQEAEPA